MALARRPNTSYWQVRYDVPQHIADQTALQTRSVGHPRNHPSRVGVGSTDRVVFLEVGDRWMVIVAIAFSSVRSMRTLNIQA